MFDSQPPPYEDEPRVSAFRRLLNRIRPALVVPVEQLRSDDEYVQRLVRATSDIRLCEDFFNKWWTGLDEIGSGKPDERERKVRHYLAELRKSASLCSDATNEILRCHAHFANMMARRIERASKFRLWFTGLDYDPDTTRLANDIARASRLLSQRVVKLQNDLASFVDDLEKMKGGKKRSTTRRILGWLKILFNALAVICAIVSAIDPHVNEGFQLASILLKAATDLSTKFTKKHDGKEPEDIDSLLLFLKETIPREAQNAQKALERFDEALRIMGLEERMIKTGRRVAISGPGSATIVEEWIKVAKRYRSMLPIED